MHYTISTLLSSYGYVVVFLIVGLESLGVPLPGETVLVTASAFAARGHLSIVGVVIAAIAGAVLGDNGGYWIGRKGGIALVHRYGRFLHLDDEKLERVRSFFDTHGAKTVFIGRFIAVLRTWAAFFAGAGRMPYNAFMMYNALGGIVWAIIFGSLGFVFGRNLKVLEHYLGRASLVLALLAALVVALILLWRRFHLTGANVWTHAERTWNACRDSSLGQRVQRRFPRAWRFVAARFTPGEYLGLHLTVGLLVSLAALWTFGAVTEDVLNHDPLTAFDTSLLTAIRAHATLAGDRIFVFVSLAGSPIAMAVLAIVGAAWLIVKRRWLFLAGWGAAFVGAMVLTEALKRVVQRPRPAGAAAFLHGESFSFPSGHALGSLVGFGMLAYLLIAESRQTLSPRRLTIIVCTVLVIVAIGLSRLYLGVHYFSDVVGGYAAGTLWLSACVSGLGVVRGRQTIARPEETPDAR
ncbi:MAG: bifunctional DedA family/phosphatase PAP2 family protein [Gemmatimonadaceae bacterium]